MVVMSITGSDLLVYINAKLAGIVTSFEFIYDNHLESIRAIDNSNPVELAETYNEVTGSMGLVMLRNDAIEQRGIMGAPHNVRLEKYITICVVERFTDKVIFQSDRVRVKSQSWQAGVKQLVRGTIKFDAIGFVNFATGNTG